LSVSVSVSLSVSVSVCAGFYKGNEDTYLMAIKLTAGSRPHLDTISKCYDLTHASTHFLVRRNKERCSTAHPTLRVNSSRLCQLISCIKLILCLSHMSFTHARGRSRCVEHAACTQQGRSRNCQRAIYAVAISHNHNICCRVIQE